jgi:hypothetical protein
MRTKAYSIALLFFIIMCTTDATAQELYSTSTKDMGFQSIDYTASEIKRTDRQSVLRIPGFNTRSAAASRWMMCVCTDLALKRGFKYWTVVYPEPPSEDVLVGFPNSPNEKVVETLGPEFGSRNALPITSVEKMVWFCNELRKRK